MKNFYQRNQGIVINNKVLQKIKCVELLRSIILFLIDFLFSNIILLVFNYFKVPILLLMASSFVTLIGMCFCFADVIFKVISLFENDKYFWVTYSYLSKPKRDKVELPEKTRMGIYEAMQKYPFITHLYRQGSDLYGVLFNDEQTKNVLIDWHSSERK